MKIEKCPHCGGEVILCKESAYIAVSPQYSMLCLGCGMEFRIRSNPLENATPYINDPTLGAKEIIEKFNRRVTQDGL